jgi:hypothetical protein
MNPRRGTITLAMRLNNRRRAIKAAWAATGLDDAAYRAMLRDVADADSSLSLDMPAANKVLDHINAHLGRKPAGEAYKGKPAKVRPECAELLGKVEALLADMKLPWAYGLTILKHNGADAWAFAMAGQFQAVIAALVVEQDKRHYEAAVVVALQALGHDRSKGETVAKALGAKNPANWFRNRDLMARMLTHLQVVANARRDT